MSNSTDLRSVERRATAYAFPVLATVLFAFFFAASTPSPLFVIFQRAWGFSPGMLTVAFSAYAIALLVALLVAGALSDHVGRRPVIIGALILQTLAMYLFACAGDINQLIIARCIQGLATGVASGALSAAVVEAAPPNHKKSGALFTSVAPLAGLATGSLVTGLSVHWISESEVVVFELLAVVFPLALLGVGCVPETAGRRAGALASLAPRFAVGAKARSAYFRSVPLLLAIWALCGLYMSLAPSILVTVFQIYSPGLNGLTVAALCGPAALAAGLLRTRPSLSNAKFGSLAIAIGLATLVAAVSGGGVVMFFAGTLIAGIGSGAGFSAVMQILAPLADEHERAELFAAIFIACYLSLSVPPIVAGFQVGIFGLLDTARVYFTLMLVVALVSGWLYRQIQLKRSVVESLGRN